MLPIIPALALEVAQPKLIYPTRPHIIRPTDQEREAFDPALAGVGLISASRRRTSTPVDTLADLFASGELGEHWRFDNVHTNQTVVDGDVTAATGLANGLVMTNPATAPVLKLVSGFYAMQTFGGGRRLKYTFGSNLTQPGTLIVCVGDTDVATHVIATGSSSTLRWQISNDGSGNLIGFAGASLDSTIDEPVASTPKVFAVEFNGASSKFRVNGTQTATGNAGTQSTNQLTLGALYDGTFGGSINFFGAFIINRLLTSTERDRVERLLGSYAGLTW